MRARFLLLAAVGVGAAVVLAARAVRTPRGQALQRQAMLGAFKARQTADRVMAAAGEAVAGVVRGRERQE
jgi:hypothetical protein